MHLNLEQFNMILKNQGAEHDLSVWREHIVSCQRCSRDFRALNELDQQLKAMNLGDQGLVRSMPERKKIPARYVLGVAAVLTMAIAPYFRDAQTPADQPEPAIPVLAQLETSDAQPAQNEVLTRVAAINYQKKVADWGQSKTNVTDLVNTLPE